jgi:hypothetical protein
LSGISVWHKIQSILTNLFQEFAIEINDKKGAGGIFGIESIFDQ